MLLVMVAPLISRAVVHATPSATLPPDAHAGHHPALGSGPADNARHLHHRMADGMDHGHTPAPHHAKAASPAAPPTRGPDSHADHEMGVDCDYCVIAARMITLLVALLLLLALGPVYFRALAGWRDTRPSPSPGTLGARGPPRCLAC